jgi:assimilatory nitrate reductase catalytic subunit
LGIAPAGLITVTSPQGRCILRALITDRVQPGQVFAPMHWTGETAPTGRVDALVASVVDPLSGQPESKAAVVALAPYNAAWFGYAVSAGDMSPASAYWARSRVANGWRAELAADTAPEDWEVEARRLFALPDAPCQTFRDPATGTVRMAFTDESRLLAALFVSRTPVAVSRDHLAAQLGQVAHSPLSGRPSADMPDPGAVVCACLNVGVNTIRGVIDTGQAATVTQVGACTGAGTNCGSCRPEIAVLLAQATRLEAAE